MPKTTVVAAKSGWGGVRAEHGRASERENMEGGRRGAAKLVQRGGVQKKKERGAKREHRAHSVFWLQGNPCGTRERGSEGFRGAEGESILLNSHASWRRGGT